ncbi:hypothetical protein [Sediminispirochaeta bajacaliforniensis]|uniref:hypothetical protein n=1 Tax=Sediminispirochaeta bajacaliforniensis TaxID=148 RepID=UPI0003796A1E|nr:hypothetical protein [Sediminispirochaeta bajacaliforniensis]
MRTSAVIIILLLIMPIGLFAQTALTGPDEPEMVVPEVILEVEDEAAEDVRAPLPEASELPLPEFSLPSPQSSGEDSLDLPVVADIPDTEIGSSDSGADFFSEALVGGGINNRLVGDISLYRLGEGPRFSLRFAHDGTDGYSGEASGTGYFDRTDQLQGTVQGDIPGAVGNWNYGLDGSYLENELGLQGKMNDASSIILRSTAASGHLRYPGEGRFNIGFEGNYRNTRHLFAGYQGESEETVLNPSVVGSYQGETLLSRLTLSYRYHGLGDEDDNRLKTSLLAEAKLASMEIGVSGGLRWDFSGQMRYPVSVWLDGAWKDLLSYNTSGGFRVVEDQWYDLWSLFPFWNASSLPSLREQWFWDGSVEITPFGGFGIRGSWELQIGDLLPIPVGSVSAISSGGPYEWRERSGNALSTGAMLFWELASGITLGTGWTGWFYDQPEPLASESRFLGYVEYSYREGLFVGRTDISVDPLEDETMPRLGFSLAWRAAEGMVMSVEGEDLLEPFIEGGRNWIGPFIEKGAQLTLQLKISL